MGSTLALLAVVAAVALPQSDSSRIYGVVTTDGGTRYTGYIRWDRNEASWSDVLDGTKRISDEQRREARRLGARDRNRAHSWLHRMVAEIFDGRFDEATGRQSGVRFGHILTLEPEGNRARVVLLTGQEVELRSGGDVGGSVREITVDGRAGTVELEWEDVRRVDFVSPGDDAPPPSDERLYGTLTTRDGQSFTGFVAWDVDEVYGSDVLDGEDDNVDHEIPFAEISRIRRAGSDAARVLLRSGRELRLDDSNDVDSGNRGIIISDPQLGDVRVRWSAFRDIEFHAPRGDVGVPALQGDGRIRGTVTTRDGRNLTGAIRWDNDEEYDWEFLDGDADGVEFDVEFGRIRSIEARGQDAARVTLLDGRSFTLEGSNDVDHGNNGIFITSAAGRTEHVGWRQFRRLDLDSGAAGRP